MMRGVAELVGVGAKRERMVAAAAAAWAGAVADGAVGMAVGRGRDPGGMVVQWEAEVVAAMVASRRAPHRPCSRR